MEYIFFYYNKSVDKIERNFGNNNEILFYYTFFFYTFCTLFFFFFLYTATKKKLNNNNEEILNGPSSFYFGFQLILIEKLEQKWDFEIVFQVSYLFLRLGHAENVGPRPITDFNYHSVWSIAQKSTSWGHHVLFGTFSFYFAFALNLFNFIIFWNKIRMIST